MFYTIFHVLFFTICFTDQYSLHRQDSNVSLPLPDMDSSSESVLSLLEEGFQSSKDFYREQESSANNLSDYEENYIPTIFSLGDDYENNSRRFFNCFVLMWLSPLKITNSPQQFLTIILERVDILLDL